MANYQPLRASRPPSAHYQPIRFAKELMQGRSWAALADNQFLFQEKRQVYLFDLKSEPIYTLADLDEMPEGAPFELLNGNLVFMASPTDTHQKISHKLTLRLGLFIEQNNLGEVRAAPYTMRLDKRNGPQPDLLFISNSRLHFIHDEGLHGPPDLVIEIASPGTSKKDLTTKKDIYGKFGVAEYWIVSPEKKTVQVFENRENELHAVAEFGEADTLKSTVLPGFELILNGLF